jgi:nucleoside-diphosphate-sugar epimerase
VLDSLIEQVHPGRMRPAELDPEVELQVGDIRDETAVLKALGGIDSVIHLAAEVGVGQSMYAIDRYTSVNDYGTAVLFQHLIDGIEPPRNLYKHASAALGDMETEANLKTATHRLMRRINKQRRIGHPIEDVEALGFYLIRTSKAVTEADLARPIEQEHTVT